MTIRNRVACLSVLGFLVATAPATANTTSPVGFLEGFRLASLNDHQLRAAQASAEAQREQVVQSEARLLPNASLSSSRSRLWQRRTDNGIEQAQQSYLSESDTLSLRQPIYQPKLSAGVEQVKAQVRGVEADLNTERQALTDRYASAYFNFLLVQEQLALTTRQLESTRVQLDAATKAFTAGQGIRTDILETQAQVDRLEATALQARRAVLTAKVELEAQLGREIKSVSGLSLERFKPTALDPGPLAPWLDKSVALAPRVQSRVARLQAAEVAASAAKFERYPMLDLIVQSSRSSSDDAYFVNSKTQTQAIGIQLTVPLYQGGVPLSRVRQTAAELTAAQELHEQARKTLEIEVRQQHTAVQEGIAMVAALEKAKASADEAVIANARSFAAGARRSLDVLAAEQKQLQAALDLSKARYQTVLAWIRLNGLVGSANEDLVERLNARFEADR
jgi:TolC family type I secretion outer membrane protein